MKKIFAYWQSEKEMPGYLQLCIRSWYANIQNLNVHFINHSNIDQYLSGTYPLEQLKKLSYAKQSDAVSVALLEKYGGLFIDVDTIITSDIFEIFEKYDANKLLAFGNPPNKGVHIAVLYARNPNNPILTEWRKEVQERLVNLAENTPWNYVGNAILEPLLRNILYKDDFEIIDRTKVGNILETSLKSSESAINGYKKLYFEDNPHLNILDVLNKVKYGIVSLHNSWTPPVFSVMSSEEFIESQCFLSKLLNFVLTNHQLKGLKTFFSSVSKDISCLDKISTDRIWSKGVYVIDFFENGCHFAFDCVSDGNDAYHLDLVLRNDKSREVIKFLKVIANKGRVASYNTYDALISGLNKYLVFIKILMRKINDYPPIKIYLEQSIYCDFDINSKKLAVSLNLISNQILIYFRDKSSIEHLNKTIRHIDNTAVIENSIYKKSIEGIDSDTYINLFLQFLSVFSIYSNHSKKIKIKSNYNDPINNNMVTSGSLVDCYFKFLGKNNTLVIHDNVKLKNIFFEFLGDNSLIEIGEGVSFSGHLRVGYGCTISVGKNTTSTNPVYFTCAEKSNIKIGQDCMFSTGNQIRTDDAHPIYSSVTGERLNISKDILIGNHVWIGYNSVILSGTTVGNGSIIGMGSIVKGEFPNNCTIVGIPSKIVKRNVFWERPLLLRVDSVPVFTQDELDNKYYCNLTKE